LPAGDAPVSGTRVAIDALPTVPNATSISLYLHSSSVAFSYLGEAVPTGVGWLYRRPDGTYGWDSTQVPLGPYSVTCTATVSGGGRYTSAPERFTVDNTTPHVWGSRCGADVPAAPADYQGAFDFRSGGWAGADGAFDIRLPDGRILWLFGDTFAGSIDGSNALLAGWRMPRNSVQVQVGQCFTPLMRGAPGAETSFIPEVDGAFFWPTGGVVDTSVSPNVARIVAMRVRNSSTGFGFQVVGVNVITLSLPDLNVVGNVAAPYDATATNMPSFGTNIFSGGKYVYLFGNAGGFQDGGPVNPGPFGAGRYVARARPANLASGPWEYWGGTGWSGDDAPMDVKG